MHAHWGNAHQEYVLAALDIIKEDPSWKAVVRRLLVILEAASSAPDACVELEPLLSSVRGVVGLLLACGFEAQAGMKLRLRADPALRQRLIVAIGVLQAA